MRDERYKVRAALDYQWLVVDSDREETVATFNRAATAESFARGANVAAVVGKWVS